MAHKFNVGQTVELEHISAELNRGFPILGD